MLRELIYILAAYLLGAVPFGIIFSLAFKGPNPLNVGSRNIGFTNVLRTSGKIPAILTLIFDIVKGGVFVLLYGKNYPFVFFVGFAAVLGHNFSPYLGFKGGKGVATGYGVLIALYPMAGIAAILIWLITFYKMKVSSVSALVSYLSLPFICFFVNIQFLIFSVCLSVFIIARHHENISRILDGKELKLKKK